MPRCTDIESASWQDVAAQRVEVDRELVRARAALAEASAERLLRRLEKNGNQRHNRVVSWEPHKPQSGCSESRRWSARSWTQRRARAKTTRPHVPMPSRVAPRPRPRLIRLGRILHQWRDRRHRRRRRHSAPIPAPPRGRRRPPRPRLRPRRGRRRAVAIITAGAAAAAQAARARPEERVASEPPTATHRHTGVSKTLEQADSRERARPPLRRATTRERERRPLRARDAAAAALARRAATAAVRAAAVAVCVPRRNPQSETRKTHASRRLRVRGATRAATDLFLARARAPGRPQVESRNSRTLVHSPN